MRKSIDFVKKVLTFQPANDKMIKSFESGKKISRILKKLFEKHLTSSKRCVIINELTSREGSKSTLKIEQSKTQEKTLVKITLSN